MGQVPEGHRWWWGVGLTSVEGLVWSTEILVVGGKAEVDSEPSHLGDFYFW